MRDAIMAVLCTLAAASIGTAAAAQEACEAPRYSSQLAEASLTAQADIRLAAIKALADRAGSQLGPNTTGNVRLEGRYAVSAAAQLAQGAYDDTVVSYFCHLERRYANDPAKLNIVRQQQRALRAEIDEYFDFDTWQPGAEGRQERRRIRDRLQVGENGPALLPRSEVSAALPNYTFDLTRIGQLNAEGSIAQFASLGVCAGWVNSSIRRLNPNVLADLQLVRTTIIDWLSGEQADAKIDVWTFVSRNMNRQITRADQVETVSVTPQFMTCLRAAERQIAPQSSEPSAESERSEPGRPAAQPANAGSTGNGTSTTTPPPTSNNGGR
ncbi:hypothetical protein [Brevundimonas sp.]|jgi:hypothetical protein|uniref:hypothetical protein n=1 Tax=Brevundimonas sp. TaxID=1871086 RepID=UPI0022C90687|nr:hypothetical protein [Brevundimonas sp.]MCZ8194662.1 hypothetical protein [Brevundimonas sp.]